MSSDISNYVRRSGQADRDDINKLLSILNPLVFPDPENSSLKERIILSPHFRHRTNTALSGLDITTVNSETRSRESSSITIIPSSSSTTAPTYTSTLSGTLTMPAVKKYGAGAVFTGTQYFTLTDTGDSLDLSGGSFGMAFWFKGNGVDQGEQVIYSKRLGDLINDYCEPCTDFNTSNFYTAPSSANAGLTISLVGNLTQNFCTACTDFDTNNFNTTTHDTGVRIIMTDGLNSVDSNITSVTNIFNGDWHSIIVNSTDSVSDYCSACTDFETDDFSVVTSPKIEVFLNGSSIGSVNHSAITGSLENSENAFFGCTNSGGTLEKFIRGTVALWEFQSDVFSTTAITDYHSNARIRSSGQKASLHFVGNSTQLDVLDNLI